MHADLIWLAENVSEWGGTYDFKHIFLEDGRADYSSVPDDVVLRTFTRAQWQAAREHLGLVTTGTEDEAFDAIAKKEKAFIDSSGYRWRSDITAYDPPGPTSIPECTFTTPDEDEAWRESEKRINPVWQSPHDAGGVCITHGVRYAAHEQCPMCVLASETTKEKSKAFENPEVKAAYDKQYSQYFRDVSYLDHIDVYRVHELFNVIDHALCHASKKLLTAGMRTGNKSEEHDVREARDTLNRWLEMRGE